MHAAAHWLIDSLNVAYLQEMPLAEVNIAAGAISVAFDDNRGQDSDCSNTHLKLRGQRLDLLLEFVHGAVAAKVCQPCPHHCLAILYCNAQDMALNAVLMVVYAHTAHAFITKSAEKKYTLRSTVQLCFAMLSVLHDACTTHV